MTKQRREFLHRVTSIGVIAAVTAAAPVLQAQEQGSGKGKGRPGHAFMLPSDTKNKCATCVFWGGQRHISRDKNAVHATSLGMCNNPASGNYHRTTSPDTGPMAAWVKWPALDA